jgi:hypothetical protein
MNTKITIALFVLAAAPAFAQPSTASGKPDQPTAPEPPGGSDTAGTPAGEPAATVSAAPQKRDRGEFLIAVKAGGLFAEAFSRLGASYLVDVELGYALPVLKHRLAITVEAAYTAPENDGSTHDPRLDASAGGAYNWHLEQRELILGLTLIYRHPIGRLTPYIGVGPRLFLLESKVSGSASGTKIITTTEDSTKVGAGIPLGLGFRLGPGDLFLELAINVSPIDHKATGDSNTGSIGLTLGYRFVF